MVDVVPGLSFSSDTRGKCKMLDGNDAGAAHTGRHSWPVMEED